MRDYQVMFRGDLRTGRCLIIQLVQGQAGQIAETFTLGKAFSCLGSIICMFPLYQSHIPTSLGSTCHIFIICSGSTF